VPDSYESAVGITEAGYYRQWVQCQQCSFIYSIYSRPKDALDKLYKTLYRSIGSKWREESSEELFNRIITLPADESETKFRVKWIKEGIENLRQDQLLDKKSPPYNFLDIGGGNGVFAYEFKDADWMPHVIDPDEWGHFMEKYGIKFIPDYYHSAAFNVKFDLISLVFVLEHLTDPASIIKDLRQDLLPGSLIYIEVPDAICFKRKDSHDDIFNSCHLWMFSPYTLNRFLHLMGFEIVALKRAQTERSHYSLMALAVKV